MYATNEQIMHIIKKIIYSKIHIINNWDKITNFYHEHKPTYPIEEEDINILNLKKELMKNYLERYIFISTRNKNSVLR